MSILGNRVVRREDPRFLTVGGSYVADLRDPLLDGALYATFVRSPVAHGELRSVETSEAVGLPGVVAILTAADVDLAPPPPDTPFAPAAMARPWLATDRVRFVGDAVAVVVTERPEQGVDAAEQVWADIEPLPAVIDPERAGDDDVVLFPAAGTNVAAELAFGRSDDLFDGCEVVVTQRVVNQRVAACPLEPRGAAAAWGDDGRLHLFVSSQNAHGVRDALVERYGLDVADVRVVTPDVGGGFGPKIGAHVEELFLPWVARRLGRPVRWHETRTENMLTMGQGRGQVQVVEIGGRRDGTVEAYRLTVVQDAGAYPSLGTVLPYMTRMMTPGVYAIPRVEFNAKSVVTNTTPTKAYRGAGRPEATAAIERALDLFAAEVGLDAAEVRRKNLVPADAFPYTTAVGTTYDTGDYERALDLALDAAGYDDLRAEQQRRREAGERVLLGIGVSCYVEVTAGPSADKEFARIDVDTDGNVTVYTGISPHGQGHETSLAMIASEELGVPFERIRVVHGDTDLVATGSGTMGSRSLQLGGAAVHQQATALVERARTIAADLLEASSDDIVLDKVDGRFHVAGTPAIARTWADVAAAGTDDDGGPGLRIEGMFEAASPTYPFGAHVAVVDVDLDTGDARLQQLVAVDDAGRILNPLLAEGQRHGGIAQGVAQALYEHVRYDDDGNPVTSNFADYAIVTAAELPSFELVAMETPTPINPLGAKGIGESGAIGATPAVQSAVCDALAHLGVRHVDMPCTPERIWQSLAEARR
jgi:carbon-monoxide dehydrogenase large subunit